MTGRRRLGACAALLAAPCVAVAAGCSAPAAAPERPNLLLVSIDALRADHLSSHGYPRPTSPFLDELAAAGMRFPHSFVNTHSTPPSHATLFTSLYQETHRVSFDRRPESRVAPEELVMVQELLRDAGYRTVAVTDGGYMAEAFGFAQGFDVFDDGARGVDDGRRRLVDELREVERPVFAFFHTYEVHSPYEPPAGYRELFGRFDSDLEGDNESLRAYESSASELAPEDLELLVALYDAGIRWTDDNLRRLFDELEEIGFLDHALVVVTSDHGEELGEHGGLLHRGHLYDELIHVPLILWGRGAARGAVDERLASSIDVAPTLLRAAGLAPPELMAGSDLLDPPPSPEVGVPAVFSQFRNLRYAVRTRDWKLIQSKRGEPKVELYDLAADPREQHNVADRHPLRVRNLRHRLRRWQRSCPRLDELRPPEIEIPAEDAERLRSLGYLE